MKRLMITANLVAACLAKTARVPHLDLTVTPSAFEEPVSIGHPPRTVNAAGRVLVVITTNEERSLPDAFIRRCIVHFIDVPDATEEELQHRHVHGAGGHHH